MKSQQEWNIYNCEYRAKHATRYDASNKLMYVEPTGVTFVCGGTASGLCYARARVCVYSLSVPSRKSAIWPFE